MKFEPTHMKNQEKDLSCIEAFLSETLFWCSHPHNNYDDENSVCSHKDRSETSNNMLNLLDLPQV